VNRDELLDAELERIVCSNGLNTEFRQWLETPVARASVFIPGDPCRCPLAVWLWHKLGLAFPYTIEIGEDAVGLENPTTAYAFEVWPAQRWMRQFLQAFDDEFDGFERVDTEELTFWLNQCEL